MLTLQQTDFANLSAENILLLGVIGALIFLAIIRKMMRDSIQAQIDSFNTFKIEIATNNGQMIAALDDIKKQSEASNRAFEKRIETIEHNQVKRDDFTRENTLLKAAYDDSARCISIISDKIENLKTLIIQRDASRFSSEKN